MPKTTPPDDDRQAFSARLRTALESAGLKGVGPIVLAREFNANCVRLPVTPHAARKWLDGEAMPSQDNLQSLASWLHVSTHWLRFGGQASIPTSDAILGLQAFDSAAPEYRVQRAAKLASELTRLTPDQQTVVEDVVGALLNLPKPPPAKKGKQ